MRVAVPLMTFALALSACNPSVVRTDDTLYRETLGGAPEAGGPDAVSGHDFYLALPLSGPRFRHPNAFGASPVLPAGLRVEVERIERGGATGRPSQAWQTRASRSVQWVGRVYRIRFHAQGGACAEGCEAHWRAPDDEAFARRFQAVFVQEDPLAQVGAEARALVEAHRVAAWFTPDLVRLAIGAPNTAVSSGRRARWVYEVRFCQGYDLVAVPSLALDFLAGELNGYERLPADGFYRPFEPIDPRAGLCRPDAQSP